MAVHTPLEIAVNTLWFSSLLLSVSSAINSLLAMTWRQAIYSTPQRRVPWWVRNRFTKIVVSALTAIVAIGLGAISVWFAWERWDFSRLRRKLWLHGERDNHESSWRMLAYDYVVGIIWRSTTTSVPTRSPSRRHRMKPIEESNTGNRRGRISRSNDHPLAVNIPTPTVAYSDVVFSELSLQWTLRLSRSEDTIRHVQFSSTGTWLAACTKSICYIYQVKPKIIVHHALKHPFGQIRQLDWSPDEKHLLIRVLYLQRGFQLKNRQKEWMGKIIKHVQWINNTGLPDPICTHAFDLLDCHLCLVLQKIREDGHLNQDRTTHFDTNLYTFAVVPSRDHVLVVTGHKCRVRDDIRFPKRTVRTVMNYDLRTGKLLYSFPLLHDARWIDVSSDGDHVILGFGNQQAPELWSFEQHGDTDRICFKHRFASSHGKDRFRGPPRFVGPRNAFVACATSVDSIQIWSREENRIVSSLPMPPTFDHRDWRVATIPVLSWHPGQAMLASAASFGLQLWAPVMEPEEKNT
ncbi:hypothetical protein K438DRAFT_1817272 [Mycena galopus ATCC 62051]|nr:hypothetical protein K438DRAFT_1817272 [Mycena galopus ATCC 62051]